MMPAICLTHVRMFNCVAVWLIVSHLLCVGMEHREASARQLPAHVVDARACLHTYGFAFVPRFGEQFAREYMSTMGRYIHQPSMPSDKKQTIAGEVTQFFMPALQRRHQPISSDSNAPSTTHSEVAAASTAAGGRSGQKRKRRGSGNSSRQSKQKRIKRIPLHGAEEAWQALQPKWHALVEKLALYLGLAEDTLSEYHVQDEKVNHSPTAHCWTVVSACSHGLNAPLLVRMLYSCWSPSSEEESRHRTPSRSSMQPACCGAVGAHNTHASLSVCVLPRTCLCWQSL